MKIIARYIQQLPPNTRSIILTCVFGLSAGMIGVLFHLVIGFVFDHGISALSEMDPKVFVVSSFLVIMGTSLVSGILLHGVCREAAGSGIPQVKLAFWKDFGVIPLRVVWVKFIAGVLSVGGGASLGREGPSVQLGAGLASKIASVLGVAKQNRRMAAAAGAAAGLAAAFNTPLAAMTFVLEEVVEDLNSRILGSMIFASVIGALVVRMMIGDHPAFKLPEISEARWQVYALTPVVAALAALVGVLFQKCALGIRKRANAQNRVPHWLMPSCGALVTWVLGIALFLNFGRLGVFGMGYADLAAAIANNLEWKIAGLLLMAKLIATAFSYGCGGCGGIFAPTLFFGAMSGVFFIGGIKHVFPMTYDEHVLLTIVAMSACLGAVVRAPVTSILIVFEMTHEFALIPGLMLGSLVSQYIGRKLNQENFYQAVLSQDGVKLQHVMPPRDLRSWQNYPVSAIARFDPVVVDDLSSKNLQVVLDGNTCNRFPVLQDGRLAGILMRDEALRAVREGTPPKLISHTTCSRTQTIKEVQLQLIEAESGMVVLLDRDDGVPVGLLTLHDLLRAERRLANQAE
ncbi:MAG: chloride channel protein [Verrucomicrobiota bacterium]